MPGDTATDQVNNIMEVIGGALGEVGASIEDVTVTRMFAADIRNDWEGECARACVPVVFPFKYRVY